MIKWELKEKYLEQDEHYHEVTARYTKAAIDAGTHLRRLIAEKDQLLRDEFAGKDVAKEKQRVNAAIEDAKKAVKEAEEDRAKAYDFAREAALEGRITVRDLSVDWNTTFVPAVKEAELTPIVERMKAARADYLNACMDYLDLIDKYDSIYQETREMEIKDARPGDGLGIRPIAATSDMPWITDDDLYKINTRKALPTDVKRAKVGEAH